MNRINSNLCAAIIQPKGCRVNGTKLRSTNPNGCRVNRINSNMSAAINKP